MLILFLNEEIMSPPRSHQTTPISMPVPHSCTRPCIRLSSCPSLPLPTAESQGSCPSPLSSMHLHLPGPEPDPLPICHSPVKPHPSSLNPSLVPTAYLSWEFFKKQSLDFSKDHKQSEFLNVQGIQAAAPKGRAGLSAPRALGPFPEEWPWAVPLPTPS